MDEKTIAVLKKLLDEAFEKNFIRLFNQGFEALISDRLGNLETGQESLEAKLEKLETGQDNLETKLEKLEVGQEEIKDQLNSLERKVDRFHDNHEQRITKLEKIRGVI